MSRLKSVENDRILLITRIVAGIVIPFLVIAFLILFFFPGRSGEWFAWEISPPLTAMYMGAGYIGGAWLFFRVLFGRAWHRVSPGFLPISAFTAAMLFTTLLHWDRFDLGHTPFRLWLILYAVTPVLIPVIWLSNRREDAGAAVKDEGRVPGFARKGLLLLGIILSATAAAGFVVPSWLAGIWPWPLSPLTARIMSGWFALLGVGGVVISRDIRWSAWKVGLQSIWIWHLLVLVASFSRNKDFTSSAVNWFTVSVLLVLVGMLVLYLRLEASRMNRE